MAYRTKTYIAGDWDGDQDLISKLHQWNNGDYWSLSFTDAHDLCSARDTSLNCSIKKSLHDRLDASKTFVLVVGSGTDSRRAGACRYCDSYFLGSCLRGSSHSIDQRSYIEYECEYAVKHGLKIVVLYNYSMTHPEKCPEVIRYAGTHIPACDYVSGTWKFNYQRIKNALMG